MIKARSFERVLHKWEPWVRAIADARLESYPDSDRWWAYAKAVMRKLHFPNKPLLCLYFLSCVFSEYKITGAYCYENIELPPFLFDKYDSFVASMAPAIARLYMFDFSGTGSIRLSPDLMGIRERPLPPAVWNKRDVKFALRWESSHGDITWVSKSGYTIERINPYEQLRKYYSPSFMVLPPGHDIAVMGSKVKRKIDDEWALLCAEMRDDRYTTTQIGKKFGWALQEGSYPNLKRCSMAERYVRRGRKLRGW